MFGVELASAGGDCIRMQDRVWVEAPQWGRQNMVFVFLKQRGGGGYVEPGCLGGAVDDFVCDTDHGVQVANVSALLFP